MDEKSLYAHILNLSALWQVSSLSLDENAGSVTVTVSIADQTQLCCPTCGKPSPIHDHQHRKWRHLDTCQFTTLVEADVRIRPGNSPFKLTASAARSDLIFYLQSEIANDNPKIPFYSATPPPYSSLAAERPAKSRLRSAAPH